MEKKADWRRDRNIPCIPNLWNIPLSAPAPDQVIHLLWEPIGVVGGDASWAQTQRTDPSGARLTLLAVVAGVLFPGWEAFAYVLTAAVAASALGFSGGQRLSRGVVERLSGSRLERLSKRLAERGTVAVALLRLVPVAPFTVFNLAAGASQLSFNQFMLGSMLGLAPGLGTITLILNSLWGVITAPSWTNI